MSRSNGPSTLPRFPKDCGDEAIALVLNSCPPAWKGRGHIQFGINRLGIDTLGYVVGSSWHGVGEELRNQIEGQLNQ